MKIIMYGNRGSSALGASDNSPFAKFGGDTTCVGIVFDDGTLISLDAGSGFWKWPYTLKKLLGNEGPYNMNLFFSHYHLDHTMGLAQSLLLFNEKNKINVYGGDFYPGLETMFYENANRPQNPDLSNHYKAEISFDTLGRSDKHKTVTLDNGACVKWKYNPHGPGEESIGYRIDHEGKSFAFITDTDHKFDESDTPILDSELVDFIKDCDALLYDCHFSDKELDETPDMRNYGHSTGEHGVRLCKAANIPMLITSHHNPFKDDPAMDSLTRQFRRYGALNNVFVFPAMPSLCLDLNLHPSQRQKHLSMQQKPQQRWKTISGVLPQ